MPTLRRFTGFASIAGSICVALLTAAGVADASRPCQSDKVTAGDGHAGQVFGRAVAVSGDTAIAGAFGDDEAGADAGAAYVFTRTDAGWIETQKLLTPAPFAGAGDLFGCSVAVSGDVAVIGARGDEGACGPDCRPGAAYVFERGPGGDFEFAARIESDAPVDGAEFGFSVAVENGAILVGAPRDRVLGVRSGAAWVFEKADGAWTRTALLASPVRNEFDLFGFSVAIGGGVVAVGSLESDEMGPASGSAFVFEKSAGNWTLSQTLFRPDGAPDDMFGAAVAVSLDTILVGARGDDDFGLDSGSVYSFERADGIFGLVSKFHVPGAHQGDRSGSTLALEGDVAVIGSRCDDSIAENSGAAFVFRRVGGSWTEAWKLKAADVDATRVEAAFGWCTALSGDTIFVGPHSDPDLGALAGAAYAFTLSGDGREGRVDTGDGSDPVDVIRLAGRTGGTCRIVSVEAGTPVSLDVARAPESLRGHYAVWILDGASGGSADIRFRTEGGASLSLGRGPRVLPIANTESPGSHFPLVSFPAGMTSRAIATRSAELLCLNPRPGHPTAPVSFSVVFPPGDFVVGGVVEDRNSELSSTAGKHFSLANWIFVRSTP